MTEFDDADGTGQTITVECIEGLRRPGGALRVLGYCPVTGAGQLPPPIGGQPQDSALPDPVVGPPGLLAASRARDGTQLLQFGLGERAWPEFSSLSGRERQRLFVVLTRPGRPGRTS